MKMCFLKASSFYASFHTSIIRFALSIILIKRHDISSWFFSLRRQTFYLLVKKSELISVAIIHERNELKHNIKSDSSAVKTKRESNVFVKDAEFFFSHVTHDLLH